MGHKRRRLILSCGNCRRRKVSCDRGHPCVRCQKAGHTDTCTYDSPDDMYSPLDTPEQDGAETQSGEKSNTEQVRSASFHYREAEQPRQVFQEKVIEIESHAESAGARPFSSEKYMGLAHPAGPGASTQRSGLQYFEQSLQRGQNFNTQYFGPSHAAGLLPQCKELSAFVRKVLLCVPSSNREGEQTRSSIEKQVESRARFVEPPNKEILISLMPPRSRADCLVQTYLNMFENTYRVLHVPTFLQRYGEFWGLPNVTPDSTIVLILLAIAAVNAFVPGEEDGFVGHSSSARARAKLWIRAAESWLRVQSQKNYTLDILQMHVLLFHAKKMNCMERKRRWTSVGTLVRVMMAAGLHREPTHLSQKILFFDAEMRRRLWYTVLELELQEACDRGMQPMSNGETWDCLPPLNIHDEDFDETTISFPCERPLDSYTRTSFLRTVQKHLLLRLEVLNKTNSVRSQMDLDTAKKYVELLKGLIDELPSWSENSISAIPRVLSKLILYEQLMILQQPFAIQASSYQRSLYLRTIQRQTAIFIMESYRSLPRLEALQVFNIRGDGFRAVLTMCYEAIHSSNQMDDLLHNKEAEIELIERTVELSDERVRSLGQGFQLYWLASSALRLIKARYSKVSNEDLMAMKTAEDAFRLLKYMNQRRKPGTRRIFGDASFGTRCGAGEQEQVQLISDVPDNLDIFSNLADFGPNDWLFGGDIGDIWNLDGI